MIYVVGFAIDYDSRHVMLVEKTHPKWQKGRLNGLGGKVENMERPIEAMAREFREDTMGRLVGSALYRSSGWKHRVTLTGADWQCLIFSGRINVVDMPQAPYLNDEGERVAMFRLAELYEHKCVANILWLIPFCLSSSIEYHPDALPLVLPEAYPGAVISGVGAF